MMQVYTKRTALLARARLEALLEGIGKARVALIGDLCLDMYWEADMRLSELSRETPHHPLSVVAERYSPGGAGNAAANLAALAPGSLAVLGVSGADWRGDLLQQALHDCGVDSAGLIRAPGIVTNAYIKPLRRGISDVVYEDPRIDFENRVPLPELCERKLLAALETAADDVDVICVSDQLRFGCVTPAVRARLSALGAAGKTVIVDSRDRAGAYHGVLVKPNEVEAARAFGTGEETGLEALAGLAARAQARNGRPALVTLGAEGCFVAGEDGVTRVPACPVEPPIDFVGAGDAFMAAFGAATAASASPVEAAQIATLAAAVTVKKLGTTGTASRAEILSAWDRYAKEYGET